MDIKDRREGGKDCPGKTRERSKNVIEYIRERSENVIEYISADASGYDII
jgi:hypothetical protein